MLNKGTGTSRGRCRAGARAVGLFFNGLLTLLVVGLVFRRGGGLLRLCCRGGFG